MIGENTKIDNQVQIAHNVRVGRNCVMAAHTGISGSVTIGDGAQFGGRAGVADHVTIGAGARIGAAAGVMKDVPAGETWGGFPARPIRQWMRETAWLAQARRPQGGGRMTRKAPVSEVPTEIDITEILARIPHRYPVPAGRPLRGLRRQPVDRRHQVRDGQRAVLRRATSRTIR